MRKKTIDLPKLILTKDFPAFLQRLKAYSQATRAFYRLADRASWHLGEEALYAQIFPFSKEPQKEETYEWHCMTLQSGVRFALQQYLHHPDPSQAELLVDLLLLCYQRHAYGFEITTYSFQKYLQTFFQKVPTLAPEQRKALRCVKSRDLRLAYVRSLDPAKTEDRPCLQFFLQDSQFDIRWNAYQKLEQIGEQPPRWSLAFRHDPDALLTTLEADDETKASWKESIDALIDTLHERASPQSERLLERLLALPWELGIEAFAILGSDLKWLQRYDGRTFSPLAHPKGIEVIRDLIPIWQRETYLIFFEKLFMAWREQAPPDTFSVFKRQLLYTLFHTKHTNHRRSLRRLLEEFAYSILPKEDCPPLFGVIPPEYALTQDEQPWFAGLQESQKTEEEDDEDDIEMAIRRLPAFPKLLSSEELVQASHAIDQMIDLYIAQGDEDYIPRPLRSKSEEGDVGERLLEAVFESLLFLFCAYAHHPQEEGLGEALVCLDWSYHFHWEDTDGEIIHNALRLLLARFPTISLSHLETLCEMNPAEIRKSTVSALRPEIPEHRELLERLRKDANAAVRAKATQHLSPFQDIPRWSLAFASDPLLRLDPHQDAHLVPVIEHILWHLEGRPPERQPQERLESSFTELINQLPEKMAMEVIRQNALSLHESSRYIPCIKRLLSSSLEGLQLFVFLVERWSANTYDFEYIAFYEGAERSPRPLFDEMLSFWKAWNDRHPYHPEEKQACKTQREVFTSLLVKMWPSDLAPTPLCEHFELMAETLTRPRCIVEALFFLFKRLPTKLLPIDRIYQKLQDSSPNVWTQEAQSLLKLLETKLPPEMIEEWSQTLLLASQPQVGRWAFEQQTQCLLDDKEQANRWVQLALSQPPLRRLLFDNRHLIQLLLEPLQQALLDRELSLGEAAEVWLLSVERDAFLPHPSLYMLGESYPLPPFVSRCPQHPAPKTPETYPPLPSSLAEAWRKIRKQQPPAKIEEWESVLLVLPRYAWHPEDEALVWHALEWFSKHTEIPRGRNSGCLLLALLYIPNIQKLPKELLLAHLASLFTSNNPDRFDDAFHRFLAPYLAQRIGETEERLLALLPEKLFEDEDED